ncbi:MAG: hypothetical protein CMJ31_12730 [Phycisphaerae bacterium]|nr:hypothetical protein [Phycisphaerae bacterium]
MSDFGMQMPGGRASRAASPNVYTVLMFAAIVGLGVAVGLMYRAATIVGPEGNPFGLQDPNRITVNADS